jgi:hypothetical protein
VPDGRRPESFVVHAGVRMAAGDRKGREALCRYAARPPLAEAQLEVQVSMFRMKGPAEAGFFTLMGPPGFSP